MKQGIIACLLFIFVGCSSHSSDEEGNQNSQTHLVELNVILDARSVPPETRGTRYRFGGEDIGLAVHGLVNQYSQQELLVTFTDGSETNVQIEDNSQGNDIVATFSALNGITGRAQTEVIVTLDGFNNVSGTMSISINGALFELAGADASAQLSDLATRLRTAPLINLSASIDSALGNLVIVQSDGRDINFELTAVGEDQLTIKGQQNETELVLDSLNSTATIGAEVSLFLDEGMALRGVPGEISLVDDFTGEPFSDNGFVPSQRSSFNHASTLTIFDSLGEPHLLSYFFVKQDTQSTTGQPNTWQLHVMVDDRNVGEPLMGTDASRATFTIVFENDGTINTTLSDTELLISNWLPLDESGFPNGALGPLAVSDGGGLPIAVPAQNSNFEIQLEAIQIGAEFEVLNASTNRSSASADFTSILRGRFIDSLVEGLTYESASRNGVTDENGFFFYRAGETVRFKVGDLSLGEFEPQRVTTPFHLLGGLESQERAKNVLVLLQSLDEDSDPNNGINLLSALVNDLEGRLADVDLGAPVLEFPTISNNTSVLEEVSGIADYVPLSQAIAHVQSSYLENGIGPLLRRTSQVYKTISLNDSAPEIGADFDSDSVETYHLASSIEIFDSLGISHNLELYFVKRDAFSINGETNHWVMYALVNGRNVGDPAFGAEPSLASYDLYFDDDGNLKGEISDILLVSNWVPTTLEGEYNGADGPQNVTAGGAVPISYPPTSSNFEIVLDISESNGSFEVSKQYQSGFGHF